MPDTLSIVHVVAPAEVGGIETAVRLLAGGQRARGHRVAVVAALPAADASRPWCEALRAADVQLERLVVGGRAYVAEWRGVREACRRAAPDVVHTHGYHMDVIGGGAARRLGLPTVTTVHGFIGGDWKNRVYEQLQRHAMRRFDAVVAVSRRMGEEFAPQRLGARLHVIPNAFAGLCAPLERDEARRTLGIAPDEFHVGWIGRLSREKGCDLMLAALAEREAGNATLSVLGDGAERERLHATAERLALSDRVRWHGVRHDASRLLRAFDAVVLSSRTEGTPLVLFEAIAAGVPVIATRVGGIPDVVSDAEAALVPPEDPRALAAALAEVRARPDDARARAERAVRRLTEAYALEPWLDAYENVYRALVARRARSRMA